MKKMQVLVLLSLFLSIVGCEKDNDFEKKYHLNGYWLNRIDNKDTLLITDSLIYRSHFQAMDTGLNHKYDYNIKQDSLELIYKGIDKITFAKPFIHNFKLDEEKNILIIEDFEKTYPGYNGNRFKLLIN